MSPQPMTPIRVLMIVAFITLMFAASVQNHWWVVSLAGLATLACTFLGIEIVRIEEITEEYDDEHQ